MGVRWLQESGQDDERRDEKSEIGLPRQAVLTDATRQMMLNQPKALACVATPIGQGGELTSVPPRRRTQSSVVRGGMTK
jgi:hypothetical protein